MSVVLRCPHCGTTRATPGDCEACHEAKVRYFCTNHEPGLWVDAPACPQCGARFGEVRRAPTPPPPVRTRPPAPSRTPAPPTPFPREIPGTRDEWEIREASPPAHEGDLAPASSPLAMLLRLLLAGGVRGRHTAPVLLPERARPGIGRGMPGCLIQIVLLFVSLAMSAFLFGG